MNKISLAMKERKIILAILMTIAFLFTRLVLYEMNKEERQVSCKQRLSIRVIPENLRKDSISSSDRAFFAFVLTIPKDQLPLRKRADFDLNRSPPSSPSTLDVHPTPPIPPSSEPRGRKRKQDLVDPSSAANAVTLGRQEKRRASTLKSMRKFRSKWNTKAHERAKLTLDADEYAKYKQTYDQYRRRETARSKVQYDKNKELLEQNDPAALERQQKKLKRYRQYYQNVTKAKTQKKTKKDIPAEEVQDKSTPFSKRTDPETRLQIADPTPDPASPEVPIENEEQRKLEAKRKRSRDYNAQFTKKAEEQARKTLSTEEFEKYQERCNHYRAKRVTYAKTRGQRLKAAKLAGDEQASLRYDHQLDMKKKRYQKKVFGTFLSTGMKLKKPGNRKVGDDDTLKNLLEQPLDSTTKREIQRRLKRRERGRIDFKRNIIRAKEGDPKGLNWLDRRKEYNKEYMQKYRAEKKKEKVMNNDPPSSSSN